MIIYSVLSYSNLDELCKEVSRLQAEGWRPQGRISAIPGVVGPVFLQAVVRERTMTAVVTVNQQ